MPRNRLPGPDVDLDTRIRHLEIRAAISELLVRYTLLIDEHEFEALGELFTEDAVFRSPGGAHEGRAAIVANYRSRGELYPITLHEVHGVALDIVDDAHARGQVVGYSEQASAEHAVITSVRYDDEYVCVGGAWLFAARRVRTLYALTPEEYARGGLAWELRSRWPHHSPRPAELPAYLTGPRP